MNPPPLLLLLSRGPRHQGPLPRMTGRGDWDPGLFLDEFLAVSAFYLPVHRRPGKHRPLFSVVRDSCQKSQGVANSEGTGRGLLETSEVHTTLHPSPPRLRLVHKEDRPGQRGLLFPPVPTPDTPRTLPEGLRNTFHLVSVRLFHLPGPTAPGSSPPTPRTRSLAASRGPVPKGGERKPGP